jgi:hypothetical protein
MFKAKLKTDFDTIFSVIFNQHSQGYSLFILSQKIHIQVLISF